MTDALDEFVKRLQDHIDRDPDLTASNLAKRAGLDNSSVRALLSGKAQSPTLRTARRICAALGTTLEEFMSNPKSQEDRDILEILGQLNESERQHLLGYAKGLAARPDDAHPEAPARKK